MENITDLDVLVPPSKKVKLDGKTIEVFQPKVRQLLRIQQIGKDIESGLLTGFEAEEKLMIALSPMIPALKEDDSIDFNRSQMMAMVALIQEMAVPRSEAVGNTSSEKKTDSSEQ